MRSPGARVDRTATASERWSGLAKSLRPGQWIKNLACLAGLIFSGKLFVSSAVAAALTAIVGFSLASSAVYLVNDVNDRDNDARNPTKRLRAIAAGIIPPTWALLAAAGLAGLAIGLAALLGPVCLGVIVAYLLLGMYYSLHGKHIVLIDVIIIALGFVLRVLFGVYAVHVKPTAWIVLCMFFLALFLGFAKRRCELTRTSEPGGQKNSNHHTRPVLSAYALGLLDLLLAMTAAMAILCYSLYTVTGRGGNAILVVTVPFVFFGLVRALWIVLTLEPDQEPERRLFRDKALITTVAVWTVGCVILIYFSAHLDIFER